MSDFDPIYAMLDDCKRRIELLPSLAEHKRVVAERDALLKAVEASEVEAAGHWPWRDCPLCNPSNPPASKPCAHHLREAALALVRNGDPVKVYETKEGKS